MDGDGAPDPQESLILVLKCNWEYFNSSLFDGECMNSASENTVVGLSKARPYCALATGVVKNLESSDNWI